MSTRSTTHFVSGGKPQAIVYRHPDGYPEGHGIDLQRFFDDVEAQTQDTRFNDASYLAAKLVVWLAGEFAETYNRGEGYTSHRVERPLDFISVGVMLEDPFDIEYRYEVDCDRQENGRPVVRCLAVGGPWDGPRTYTEVEIPAPESVQ